MSRATAAAAAGVDKDFYLWTTAKWRSQHWTTNGRGATGANGRVTSAHWSPDGRMLLLSFAERGEMWVLYLVNGPPTLYADIQPVTGLVFSQPDRKGLSRAGACAVRWRATGAQASRAYAHRASRWVTWRCCGQILPVLPSPAG